MPYIGVQRKSGNQTLEVKLHGPLDTFSLDPKELKDAIDAVILRTIDEPLSSLPRAVANTLRDVYGNGEDILWVEVKLTTGNDVLYGASAEGILVQ